MCLTLNQKLKIINLSEKNMSKAKFNQKVNFLHQTVSQTVTSKDMILKEMKNATPVNTLTIRKLNHLTADRKKVLLVRSNQPQHAC